MTQCPCCGVQVDDAVTICPDCGTQFGASAPPANPSEPCEAPTSPPDETTGLPGPVPRQGVSDQSLAKITLKRAGALTDQSFNLGEVTVIGRFDPDTGPVDVDLGIVPESVYISRHHAEISKKANGSWAVRDLGSSNGTFLRDRSSGKFGRVEGDGTVVDGDEIALGNAVFVFNTGQQATP